MRVWCSRPPPGRSSIRDTGHEWHYGRLTRGGMIGKSNDLTRTVDEPGTYRPRDRDLAAGDTGARYRGTRTLPGAVDTRVAASPAEPIFVDARNGFFTHQPCAVTVNSQA